MAKPTEIKDTYEITIDGDAFIDGEPVKMVTRWSKASSEVNQLGIFWTALHNLIRRAKFPGFGAHAWLSEKKKEAYVDLRVIFWFEHKPGTSKTSTPDSGGWEMVDPGELLPEAEVREIGNKIGRLVNDLKDNGFLITPSYMSGSVMDFGIVVTSPKEAKRAIDLVVQLSLEYGLDSYLWSK